MTKKRLFGIDFLRFTAMIAIIHFHTHEFFFYSDTHVLRGQSLVNTLLEYYSRFMSFSGFTIIILSFFLLGYKQMSAQKWKKLIIICILGVFVLLLSSYDGHFYLEWDIYSYVIASLIGVALLRLNKTLLYISSALFFILLCLPRFLFLEIGLPNSIKNIIVGDYNTLGAGSWPLVPWFGLALVFYCIGHMARKDDVQDHLKRLNKKEIFLWFILLLGSLPQMGAYYEVPIGPNFYNYVFNRGTLNFWSHIIWVLFIVRLTFCESINQWFNSNKYFNWISRLELNQRFFLFYIVQLCIIGFLANFSDFFISNPWWIDIYLISFIPIAELFCKNLVRINRLVKL